MNFPQELKYTKDHEWAKIDGNTVVIGVTDHAQSALGDIVFCELPSSGKQLKAHETFGVLESIKAVSDLYSPVTGEVIEFNDALTAEPSLVNKDPYGAAWMIKIKLTDASSLNGLLSASEYEKYVASLG